MTPSELPIRVHENDKIVMSDGIMLSALIWLPEDAEANPVPAILEYLPYRKRDGTAQRDALNHPYFAARGYACVRVDMRGTGDSEGVLLGEYIQKEQDDALAILEWIAAQTWCTGSVGMIGISWGGFNGLQVAALQPPQLKAVISLCSTDDRYADDVHYMGGCQLVENFLWASTMLSVAPTPPDPALVGEDKWREMWLERLEVGAPYISEWHEHQRRDSFWKHASICEDYSNVQCPVFLVSGWFDAYSNAVFRMLENLQCPKRGLIGPWGHKYPNFAHPKPQIGFLQECLRWWDKWLKDEETGITDEPELRCYLQDTVPPKRTYETRPGHWVAEETWPSKGVTRHFMSLAPGSLLKGSVTSSEHISFCSPQTVGFTTGRWIPYGSDGDVPGDQRLEAAAGCLCFDSEGLTEPLDLLGPAIVHLRVASDKPNAFVAAVLSEVLPDGSATRISYGLFNLTHHDSNNHVDIKPLVPGEFYDVAVRLNEFGQRIGVGSHIRLALSTTYFPTCWPSPESPTLTIDCSHSKLELPRRLENPLDAKLPPFQPPACSEPLRTRTLREPTSKNTLLRDLETDETTICYDHDEGWYENEENGWRWGGFTKVTCAIRPDDPLSGRAEQTFRQDFGREDLELAIHGWTKMTATATQWHITTRLEAWENGKRLFEQDNSYDVVRDHV